MICTYGIAIAMQHAIGAISNRIWMCVRDIGNRADATRIMLHVHQKGIGICGVYTFEVAETKVTQVMDFARQHQHPLQCTMEKE